jgi:hypothetical protein
MMRPIGANLPVTGRVVPVLAALLGVAVLALEGRGDDAQGCVRPVEDPNPASGLVEDRKSCLASNVDHSAEMPGRLVVWIRQCRA